MKALVAVERTMAVVAHGMLSRGEFYRDLGANYFAARRRDRTVLPRVVTSRGHLRFRRKDSAIASTYDDENTNVGSGVDLISSRIGSPEASNCGSQQ
jgi:hypothetical protein